MGLQGDWNVDWHRARLQIKVQYVGHTPAFEWSERTLKSSGSGRGGRVLQSPDFVHKLVKMYVNISFFYILNEIQKYLRKISARIGIFSFGT
jgi:hypothetical protein